MHIEILDLESFAETFLYFFSQGSNAEFVSINRDLFFLLHDRLYGDGAAEDSSPISINEEIGGHSAVWLVRAQIEGCKAYAAPWPNDYNIELLRRMDLNGGKNLILPLEHMEEKPQVNRSSKQDTHLVFEYVKGD